jgi:hypothetical protein
MRYHVISLVAVLLALGIGILLGTTLVERGLISEQKSQIQSLRKTFDEIKKKNKSLNDELKVYQDFASQARPYLVGNGLAGKSFAVLTKTGASNAEVDKIKESITAAGGSVPVVINLEGQGVYSDRSVLDKLSKLFQLPADPQVLKPRVLAEVVNQVVTASNPAMLTELDKAGVLHVSGGVPGPLTGGVLLSDDQKADQAALDQLDVPLIKALVGAGFPLIGVGGENTDDRVLSVYKSSGISTADHVNAVPGQIAMVMSLEGRGGSYGSGGSADRLIPQPAGM